MISSGYHLGIMREQSNFFFGGGALHSFMPLKGGVLVISSPPTTLSACVPLPRYMICYVTILSFISTKVDDLFIHVG